MTVTPFRTMVLACLGLVAFVAAVAGLGLAAGGGMERTVTVFLISLIAVAGMGIYSGNTGILSFGHLSFMAIGAYASGVLTMPLAMRSMTLPNLPGFLAGAEPGFVAALVIAVAVATVFALVVGLVISKLNGAAATIATLALLIITHGLIIGGRDFTRGSQSFFGVPRETTIVVAAIGCAIALVAARLYRDSVPGLKTRAAREDAIAAEAMGVRIRWQRLLAWTLSGAVVGLSGALIAHYLGAFSPKKFYFVDTFLLLAMLIVGGMTTVTGAVVGAVAITLVIEVLRRLEGGFDIAGFAFPELFGATQIGIGLAILFVMFRRADGLAGLKEWDEWLFGQGGGTAAPAGGTNAVPPSAQARVLEGRDLTKRFAGLIAVNDVSIAVAPGAIVGLIGPNGSGKSTLLNMLSGVLPATGGDIRLGGSRIAGMPAHRFPGLGIARTFQNIRLFDTLTVRQNVMVSALIRWPRASIAEATGNADRALADMGIAQIAARRADTLSYGDKRRVEIARALALNPAFLFLDEPAAGMNREETDALMGTLNELRERRGLGIVIVDHDLPLIIRLCDRVLVLNEGRLIAEGEPEEVQRHPAVVEAYLGRKHSQDLAEAS